MIQLNYRNTQVFGWSQINNKKVVVPKEANELFNFTNHDALILFSGNTTSGGFILSSEEQIKNSPLKNIILKGENDLSDLDTDIIQYKNRTFFIVPFDKETMTLLIPDRAINEFGLNEGDKLIATKGSEIACVFVAKGPIYEESLTNTEIPE